MMGVFDLQAFENDVMNELRGSPVAALLATDSIKFDLHNWSGDLESIKKLAPAVVASIQIVKANLQSEHPGEDWNRIAIETAQKILKDSIVLTGFWGKVKSFILGPVIRGLLEGALATFKALAKGGDWLGLARAILALAVEV